MDKEEVKILLLAERKKTEAAFMKARLKLTNELCANSAAKAKRCQKDCHPVMLIVQSGKVAQLGKYLEKIKQAFKNLENGVYGICSGCRDPISAARLLVCPATNVCCDCKTSMEVSQKQNYHQSF